MTHPGMLSQQTDCDTAVYTPSSMESICHYNGEGWRGFLFAHNIGVYDTKTCL